MADARLVVRNVLRVESLTTDVAGIETAAITGRSNAAKIIAGTDKPRTLSIISQISSSN